MRVYVLYNEFDEQVERVSCDGKKINEMASEYNGDDGLGPYIAIPMELEDYDPKGCCNDCGKPLGGLCPQCRYTLVDLKR